PGRLLDLDSFSSGHIRLVNSSEMEEVKYIALSHCWGTAQAMTTNRANLEEHGHQIPIDDLPKTFREAAMITVGLDVRFLWIDSLCIVQDDLHDWEVESAKMAAVYGLSYLTIAVLHSPDNHGGCFLTRHWQNGEILYERPFEPTSTILSNSTPISTPLESRAWALQERLLSRRTLLIYPGELVWECMTTAACECRGLQFDAPDADGSWYQIQDLKGLIRPRKDLTAVEAAGNWLRIISFYSRLRLTRYSDTLPALSGLAAHFSQFIDGQYLGGIWSGDLARSLLWECQEPAESVDRSLPSWSWTAV
ncbi:HET-domain-containing protein, partial [Cadophora sp. DSE1049]